MKTYRFFFCGIILCAIGAGFAGAATITGEGESESMSGESWFSEDPSLTGTHRRRAYVFEYGDPTPAEQAHLEAVNRARLNPQVEANRLLGGNLNEGINPPVITTAPKQPLTFNSKLLTAARLHSQDMIANNYFSHYSLDGRTPGDRIADAGYLYAVSAENISTKMATYPLNAVSTLLGFQDGFVVNSDNPDRGHRKNVFLENVREIGAGAASVPSGALYSGYPYAWVLTCNYATSSENSNSFVLGVVYDDQNSDTVYTAGEGMGNVEIAAIEQGGGQTVQTTTASAGGYGMSLPPGSWLIRATLADGKQAEHAISISNMNIKTDFLLSEFVEVFTCGLAGDTDGNQAVELADAVVVLRIYAGMGGQAPICLQSDINADGNLGLEEVLYVLQTVATIR